MPEAATSNRVEISFTPTAKDYAQAQQWISRKAMGQLYWLYLVAIISIGFTGAFGFILLLDAAFSSHDPAIIDQAVGGAALFVVVLYIGLALKTGIRHFISRRTYVENGYFLASRTMIFTPENLQNNSATQQMTIAWQDVLGIFENKHHIFIQTEPAFTLFIPKRITNTPEELVQLKDFATKMRAESAPKA